MAKLLSYEIFGPAGATKTIAFLHGILGHKRNWRTPALAWNKKNLDFRSITIDHRGHGLSGTMTGRNTVESCAQDVKDIFDHELMPSPHNLMAHSFGGKVALKYIDICEKQGIPVPAHTWILDSMPRKYVKDVDETDSNNSVFKVFSVLNGLPTIFPSREWFVAELCRQGISRPIALWLATNVNIDDTGTYRLGCDLPIVTDLFMDFCELDMWEFLETYTGNGQIHFVRAGKNPLWEHNDLMKDMMKLAGRNHRIHVHTMPNVGHWLHTDDLEGLINLTMTHSGLNSS